MTQKVKILQTVTDHHGGLALGHPGLQGHLGHQGQTEGQGQIPKIPVTGIGHPIRLKIRPRVKELNANRARPDILPPGAQLRKKIKKIVPPKKLTLGHPAKGHPLNNKAHPNEVLKMGTHLTTLIYPAGPPRVNHLTAVSRPFLMIQAIQHVVPIPTHNQHLSQ